MRHWTLSTTEEKRALDVAARAVLDAINARVLPRVEEISGEQPLIDVEATLASVLTWRRAPRTAFADLVGELLEDHRYGLELDAEAEAPDDNGEPDHEPADLAPALAAECGVARRVGAEECGL
jgi:hypothetical protein